MKTHDLFYEYQPVLRTPADWELVAPDSPLATDVPESYRHWYMSNRHSHADAEILIALAGESWYGVGDGHVKVVPGTVLLLESMTPHQQMYPRFESLVVHLWIHLLPNRFSAGILTISGGQLKGSTTQLVDVPGGISLELPSSGPNREVRRLATVSSVVAALLDQLEHPPEQQDTTHQHRRMVATIQAHLEHTAGCGDTIETLARIAGYSRYHFVRLFKEYAGCTVQEYIDLCRRRRVLKLLGQHVPRKAIGYELGFSSPQAFSRWCRHHEIFSKAIDKATETDYSRLL